MTGTDAFHPKIESKLPSALEVCTQFLLAWISLATSILALACVLSLRISAADIAFPTASPYHTIHVRADTVARTVRGSYDVLAFRSRCSLRQGELTASCQELILWIEHARSSDPSQPRKFICTMEGEVQMHWDSKPLLDDSRWMGHLFSYQEVSIQVLSEENRSDIPHMDWNRENSSWVVPAQYAGSNNLGAASQALPNSINNTTPPPLLPAPLPSPANNSRPLGAPLSNPIQSTPGAMPWSAEGRTNQSQLPVGGLEITENGSVALGSQGVGSTPAAGPTPYSVAQPTMPSPPLGAKLLSLRPRSASRPPIVRFASRPERGDSVATVSNGIILSITGVELRQSNGTVMDFGNVTIETDNAVIWVSGNSQPDIFQGFESFADRPIELYLEGNIVLHQGQRVIYADRMYYNVSSEYGMVLSAEILTPIPQYQGLLRLKADVLEQRNRQNFLAYGAAFTSSRLGVPRYWMQADRVQFQDNRAEESIDSARPPAASSPTNMLATSRNNFVYLAGVPITYWPIFTTNLDKPSFYLTGLKAKNDQIFGTQVFADFDLYQLAGIKGPDGTRWNLSTDYLSKRGPAVGTYFDLNRPSFLWAGPTSGYVDAWFIDEHGLDQIGSDRQNLVPEASTRGRAISRFRSFLTPNIELWSEVGYLSDRNFLEQYFENEWDQQKDHSTALRLRRYNGNRMLDIWGQARINDFFTESEWLPRADHFWLGQDLGSYLSWSEHTSVGYAHQRTASTPTDPRDAAKFALLPWESDSEGLRAATRQELSAPVNLGPWKVIPYLSGEAAYWGEDVNNDPLTRLTGQGGIRTALPFWRAYPEFNNSLLDINGLAHKVTLEAEAFYADSSKDLSLLPLYDPLDDNSQEHFRRRMIFNTFGGVRPDRFEERNFALRQGMQRYVTANSTEIVDDMQQVRLGLNQRWQTKRGSPGRERIVDLVSLDVDLIGFPKAGRDNFGEDVGALNYDFRYHIGDRLTLLSDGYFDVFSQGLKAVSAGAMVSRPGRGQVYVGMLSLEGPISSNVLNAYMNYRLNEKWVATGGAAWDFGAVGSIGQTLTLTRIGESALIQLGVNVDSGRDNVSFNFNIEPRFIPSGRIGSAGGQLVTPAGLYGVE